MQKYGVMTKPVKLILIGKNVEMFKKLNLMGALAFPSLVKTGLVDTTFITLL